MATAELQAIVLRARITGGGPVQLFTPWSRM